MPKEAPDDADKALKNRILNFASGVEDQLNAELERLDKLDREGIEKLREERLDALRQESSERREWEAAGHGSYEECDEGQFFRAAQRSKRLVAHFYSSDQPTHRSLENNLSLLANNHVETRFIRLDVLRCPFLKSRLHLEHPPILLLISDGLIGDRLTAVKDMSTDMLEWRLARADVIRYDGDVLEPPTAAKKIPTTFRLTKRALRGSLFNDGSDSENELE